MKNYSPVHIAYLREGYKHMNIDELTLAFNQEFKLAKERGHIRSALKNHGLTLNKPTGSKQPRLLTLEQDYFIRELYKCMTQQELLTALNNHYKLSLKLKQLTTYLKNHNITSGRTGKFEKGITPWNTGTKGVMKPNSGNFKKGNISANTRELGAERVCSKDDYILVKVSEKNPYTKAKTRFRHKHQVLWEQHHKKKVPAGFTVTFLDGDKRNFDNENLVLVSRNLLCRYNRKRINELPKEYIAPMKSVVNLTEKIREKSKSLSNS